MYRVGVYRVVYLPRRHTGRHIQDYTPLREAYTGAIHLSGRLGGSMRLIVPLPKEAGRPLCASG